MDHVTVDLTDLGETLQLVRDASTRGPYRRGPAPAGLPAGTVFRTNLAAAYNVIEAAVLTGAAPSFTPPR